MSKVEPVYCPMMTGAEHIKALEFMLYTNYVCFKKALQLGNHEAAEIFELQYLVTKSDLDVMKQMAKKGTVNVAQS